MIGRLIKLRKTLQKVLLCSSLLSLTLAACREGTARKQSESVTISFYGYAPGSRAAAEKLQRAFFRFTQETGIRVKLIPSPEDVTERLPFVLGMLNKKSNVPDVYYMDVIWPGILAEHFLDLNPYLAEQARQYLPTLVKNNTVGGRLVGIPLDTEAGLLYYRTDLLPKYGYAHPPDNWDELERIAARIQAGERTAGNPNFWGFVWQGAPYEGLTCNAMEWQVSYGGGKIIEADGTITVNNPQTVKAMKKAKGWVGTISPPSVTAYKENDSWYVWEKGNAAFGRFWISPGFVEGEAEHSPLQGKFARTSLPSARGGTRHAATLGGELLGVSKYSAHPREAVDFVRYMTSQEMEYQRWFEDYSAPTLRDFFDDERIRKVNPDIAWLKQVLADDAVARPSAITGKHYDEVSRAYFTAVHDILTGKIEAERALADLESQLVKITGFPTGQPPRVTHTAAKIK